MIDQTIIIPNSTVADIYNVLLDSKKHSDIIGDRAEVDAEVGGAFSAFSGYATGNITKLVPNKLIEQTWRASDWEAGHYSTITFELSDVSGGTQIHFSQTDLPNGTEAEFKAGWNDNYWTPLKTYFTK